MKLSIQGIGAVSPADEAPDLFFQTAAPQGVLPQPAAGLHRVEDTSAIFDFVPKRNLRRVDHFSRLGLLAAGRALKDTDPALCSKERMGVIVASGFGALETTFAFLDSYIDKGDRLASPTHFSNSVHNAAAAHISICYGIRGPNLTVSQFDLSFISALMTARIWLYEEMADAVLIGSCDAFCDVLGYCVNRFYAQKHLKSYDFAESAFFFIVTRDDANPRYGLIDDIFIGANGMQDIPDDALLILSESSVTPCRSDLAASARESGRTVLFSQRTSPTDCGMNLFKAMGLERDLYYLKQDGDGRCGRFRYQMP